MQLVFTIHVIITLLMLKPATSKTCEILDKRGFLWAVCPKTNMYLTELPMEELQTVGKCCEAVDPSYANQNITCSSLAQPMSR